MPVLCYDCLRGQCRVYPLDDVSQPRLIGPKIKTRAEAFKAAIDYVMGQSWLPEAVVKNLINLMGVEQP